MRARLFPPRARRARSPPRSSAPRLTALAACASRFAAPTSAKYDADGTGRDTYIRRDPVNCFGKQLYMPEQRLITRFGAAGSRTSSATTNAGGKTSEDVGGVTGGFDFARPARFLRPKVESYPVEVKHYTTMAQLIQNANAPATGGPPTISGYTGFKPRNPTAVEGSAEWTDVSSK